MSNEVGTDTLPWNRGNRNGHEFPDGFLRENFCSIAGIATFDICCDVLRNDTHPGAPFNSEFRDLVKSEIARLSAEPAPITAQAEMPKASHPTAPGAAPAAAIEGKTDAAAQRRHGS
jgi:hypothetical protein